MKARTRALLGSAATVVVIAAVILGLWAFGSARKPSAPTIVLSPQQRSQQALKDGLSALSREQTGTATELLQNALTIDPNNTAAKEALAKLKSGSTSSGSSSSSSSSAKTSSTTTKTQSTAPAATWETALNIAKLLPTTYPDYSLGTVTKVGSDAVVSGDPAKQGAVVTKILWTVHDRGSDAKASDFIKQVSKTAYAHNGTTIDVNDVSAYFGTDGAQGATVAYVRGRYVFQVEITTTQPPADEQTFAQQAADAFPTSP